MSEQSKYIGKYVCYDQLDGGACWGRIKAEAKVNTMKGEKEVFILTERWVRYHATEDKSMFRVFYPDPENSPLRRNLIMGSDGQLHAPLPGQMYLEVRKVRGDSTLRKESINLERDIIDIEEMVRRVGTQNVIAEAMQTGDKVATADTLIPVVGVEDVFRAVMMGRQTGVTDAKSAAEIGLRALMQDAGFKEKILAMLKPTNNEVINGTEVTQ